VASTITEWLYAIAFCAYILTFTEEFRDVRISPPKVLFMGQGWDSNKESSLFNYNNILSELFYYSLFILFVIDYNILFVIYYLLLFYIIRCLSSILHT